MNFHKKIIQKNWHGKDFWQRKFFLFVSPLKKQKPKKYSSRVSFALMNRYTSFTFFLLLWNILILLSWSKRNDVNTSKEIAINFLRIDNYFPLNQYLIRTGFQKLGQINQDSVTWSTLEINIIFFLFRLFSFVTFILSWL